MENLKHKQNYNVEPKDEISMKNKKTKKNSKIYNKNKIHREKKIFLLILCSIIEIQPEEEKLKNDCYER